MSQLTVWILFHIFIFGMLTLDLGIFHRRPQAIGLKESLIWSLVWLGLAGVFNYLIYTFMGEKSALEFATGYIIEKSLSVDNLFIFIMIFSYFRVPDLYQHKILFWGILGALMMRAIFIAVGVSLIATFHWTIYLFGLFLMFTGFKMLLQKEEFQPARNPIMRILGKFIPVTTKFEGANFFTKENGRRLATPLFVVLVMVETTDLLFAVDSIPAILAISKDPFIVYTSNIFAILGLRALYFALAGVIHLFHYLKYGLSLVLIFIGCKMLLENTYPISIQWSLGIIGTVLLLSIAASLLWPASKLPATSIEPH